MNIKDHIEAGHYERDDKGRALVPTRSGDTLVVCATDRPGLCPIFGYRINDGGSGGDTGFGYYADSTFLLPPAPRKVKVKGNIIWKPHGPTVWDLDSEPRRAWQVGDLIPFETEFEEPWP